MINGNKQNTKLNYFIQISDNKCKHTWHARNVPSASHCNAFRMLPLDIELYNTCRELTKCSEYPVVCRAVEAVLTVNLAAGVPEGRGRPAVLPSCQTAAARRPCGRDCWTCSRRSSPGWSRGVGAEQEHWRRWWKTGCDCWCRVFRSLTQSLWKI